MALAGLKPVAAVAAETRAGAKQAHKATAKRNAVVKRTVNKTRGAPRAYANRVNSRQVSRVTVVRTRPTTAQLQGLRHGDPLSLVSSVALVVEEDTFEVLFAKNPDVPLPIASITKLMTAMVVLDAGQSMDEIIRITQADLDTEKGTGSRLSFGTELTRRDMLRLALMSSENRAANALGRHYPGGLQAFVKAMNIKARLLSMQTSQFVDPTGLSSRNVASAGDLARLVRAASMHPVIREFSTYPEYSVQVAGRRVDYRNTNALLKNASWDISLQKTGYISEAGKCLVMQAVIKGKNVVIVLLDAMGQYGRFGDANRIKSWVEAQDHGNSVARVY